MDRFTYQQILESITIEEGLSAQELNDRVQPLREAIRQMLPKRLFRCRECNEYNIDAFRKDEVWMSTADKFNDPFDTLIKYDAQTISKLFELLTKIDFNAVLAEYFAKGNDFPKEIKQMFDTPFLAEAKNKILHPNSIQYNNESTNIESFVELLIVLNVLPAVLQRQATVACFTETIDSILMWSHYAHYHQGFALGYDLQPITQNQLAGVGLFPVIYDKKRYDANHYIAYWLGSFMKLPIHMNDNMASIKLLLYKALEWEYEKEWRLMKHANSNGLASLSEPVQIAPNSIYYGCRIADESYQELHEIAQTKGLEEYKMVLDEGGDSYNLKVQPLS